MPALRSVLVLSFLSLVLRDYVCSAAPFTKRRATNTCQSPPPADNGRKLTSPGDLQWLQEIKCSSMACQDPTAASLEQHVLAAYDELFSNSLHQTQENGHLESARWEGTDGSLDPVLLTMHASCLNSRQPPSDCGRETSQPDVFCSADIAAVMGILGALSSLSSSGFKPQRTLLLAFGHLNGLSGDGVMPAWLQSQLQGSSPGPARKLHFVLSPNNGLHLSGFPPFANGTVATISTAHKGSLIVKALASSKGGHSMMPPVDHSMVCSPFPGSHPCTQSNTGKTAFDRHGDTVKVAAVLARLTSRMLAHDGLRTTHLPQPVKQLLSALPPERLADLSMRKSLQQWQHGGNDSASVSDPKHERAMMRHLRRILQQLRLTELRALLSMTASVTQLDTPNKAVNVLAGNGSAIFAFGLLPGQDADLPLTILKELSGQLSPAAVTMQARSDLTAELTTQLALHLGSWREWPVIFWKVAMRWARHYVPGLRYQLQYPTERVQFEVTSYVPPARVSSATSGPVWDALKAAILSMLDSSSDQEEQVLVLPSLQLEAPMESYEDLAPGRTYAFSPFPATPAVAAASPDRHSEAQVQSQTFYKRLLLDVLA